MTIFRLVYPDIIMCEQILMFNSVTLIAVHDTYALFTLKHIIQDMVWIVNSAPRIIVMLITMSPNSDIGLQVKDHVYGSISHVCRT